MLCNICNKKEATIHLTEIVNNQVIELHLCEACAKDKGTEMKGPFSFTDLLAGLADFSQVLTEQQADKLKCSQCGLSYRTFEKTGRLGCGGCYRSFGKVLLPLIKRVQRSTQHVGKKPAKLAPSIKSKMVVEKLKDELDSCIRGEILRARLKSVMK